MPRNARLFVIVTAAVVALTRFVALSKTPWDWDEVLFCLALNDYNVAWHQPHPPGFPLFIVLGRFFRLFTGDDFHALQTVNVIAGMLAFPVMFFVARAFRMDFHGAYAAGLLFAFLPNVWFYGGTAFSDFPAALLFLGATGALFGAGLHARRYYAGAVLLAAGVLFRPQNALVAVFPWAVATLRFLKARRLIVVIGASIVLVLIVAIGYGGAMLASGVDPYLGSLKHHSTYVKSTDSYGAPGRPPLADIFWLQLDPYDAGKASIAINVLMLIGIVAGKRSTVTPLLLTFAPSFLFAMFAVNPMGASRFSLNYIAGIVMLAVEGAAVLGRLAARVQPRAEPVLRAAAVGVIVVRLIVWVLPAFDSPRKTASPPVMAAQWLAKHVPTSRTIFVDESAWPWARYYLPKHKQVRAYEKMNIVTNPDAATGWYIANGQTNASSAVQFFRPRTRTWNIVTKRAFEAHVQPSANVVMFAAGWHGPEGDLHNAWRWGKQRSLILLGPTGDKAELRMRFMIPIDSLRKPVTVTFTINGTVLARMPIAQPENDVRFIVSTKGFLPNKLGIEVSDSFIPAKFGSHDTRELAFMMRSIDWNRL